MNSIVCLQLKFSWEKCISWKHAFLTFLRAFKKSSDNFVFPHNLQMSEINWNIKKICQFPISAKTPYWKSSEFAERKVKEKIGEEI